MTAFTAALASMRSQLTAQVQGNGIPCDVQRFSGSTDQSGRNTGSYASIMGGGKETLWIQPYSISRGGSAMMQAQGVMSETTHIGYQAHGGVALIAKDRIIQSGDAFAFDVVDQQVFDTHNELLLKQVRRT